jgi:hypothetical protein
MTLTSRQELYSKEEASEGSDVEVDAEVDGESDGETSSMDWEDSSGKKHSSLTLILPITTIPYSITIQILGALSGIEA